MSPTVFSDRDKPSRKEGTSRQRALRTRITPRLVNSTQPTNSSTSPSVIPSTTQDTVALSQLTPPAQGALATTSTGLTDKPSPAPPSTHPGLFEVQAILDHREQENEYEYLIHWEGYDMSESTWEPPRHVVPGALELVLAYHARRRRWFGNIEAVLDRKPPLKENENYNITGAKYRVQWEGWEGEEWQTWEALDFKEYQEIICEWLEAELGHSVTREL
ncbi:MAG: hypothetical protein COW65_18540 [Cytophagales bacterium CG18_big_fil_WC_8_21_14_2_50_42_9]|nr:MAG: hypothetical protein COW65_18540 [Cytophagales bacterium CG18_big_fil_WC_8_21_14_2_50_42_9]